MRMLDVQLARGRTVTPVDQLECADCYEDAVYIVDDVGGRSWFWCGECEVE